MSESFRGLLRRLGEIPRRAVKTPAPLSFAQERLFFLEQLEPGTPLYNAPVALQLDGPLDVGSLQRSLAEIVRRHEALRTTFRLIDGRPMQEIHDDVRFELRLVETADERDAWARADAVGARPFDFERGPIFGTTLFRLGAERHLLLLASHHITADSSSLAVLLDELRRIYGELVAGRASPLAELPIQYADYALWQREALARGRFDAQLAYWRRQLDGCPALTLPADRPRPPVQTSRGRVDWIRFAPEQRGRVHALAKACDGTPFMVLFALGAALLYRWSGQEDFALGTPVANRALPELEELIGFFNNVVVMRTRLAAKMTFRELLAEVRERALEAYENQDLPFEKLVEALNPERALSHAPLFQVLLSYDNALTRTPRMAGLRAKLVRRYTETAKFDLQLGWVDVDGELRCAAEYSTDLFEADTVARLLGSLRALTLGALAQPDAPIDELPLWDERERPRVEAALDGPSLPERDQGAHAPFEAEAARRPEAPAAVCGGASLGYRELDERAGRWARALAARGVGPETRVALFVERSLDMLVGMLAVLKTGAAYVPLDPGLPRERLAFLLEDSGAKLILAHERTRERLPSAVESLWLDQPPQGEGALPTVRADHAAYVIYTSGSTGRPKGIVMPHRALANLLAWNRERFGRPVRVLQLAPLGFDVSFLEIFAALGSGGTVVVLPDCDRWDLREAAALIAEQSVDTLFAPVGWLQQLAEQLRGGRLASLRDVIATGEQLHVTPAMRELGARLGCALHDDYGPSETHVVTSHRLGPDPARWPALPPIGRPIANTRVRVLDARRRPLPIGVPGELYVGGAALARGYTRSELTAERFVTVEGERLYDTGDRVRLRSDGELEFLGRADDQLKIRGFRVEPAEVEAALEQHPAVGRAAVIGEEHAGGRRLVAFVESKAGDEALRAHLAARLPEYMIPSQLVAVAALPLSPNGKIDRRSLVAPAPVAAPSDAPATALEAELAAIWSALLDRPVGPHDDFFALGGHSILGMRLVERVRERLGVKLAVMTLFRAPTVAALAREIEKRGAEPPIPHRGERASHPLSKNQEYTDAGHPLDIVRYVFRGPLDVALLEACFDEIVHRHEVLRTRFTDENGRTVQSVAPHQRVPLPIDDLRALDPASLEMHLAALESEERRPLDLEREAPFRVRLLWLAGDRHLFHLAIHHRVFDGLSGFVLLRLLTRLYAKGRPVALDPLPFQYADFAAWQQAFYDTPEGRAQMAWWRRQLDGARQLALPVVRREVAGPANDVHEWTLPDAIFRAARRFAAEVEAPLHVAMLAGWFLVLRARTGERDLTLMSTHSGRYRPETQHLIGYFAQEWMLRLNLGDDPSFRALVARCRRAVAEAQAHGDVNPVELIDNQRVRYNYMPVGAEEPHPGIVAEPWKGLQPGKPHEADLVCEMIELPESIFALFRYQRALFTADQVAAIAGDYERLLAAALDEPDRPISAP